jgi:hypothetical protein
LAEPFSDFSEETAASPAIPEASSAVRVDATAAGAQLAAYLSAGFTRLEAFHLVQMHIQFRLVNPGRDQ